MCSYSSTYIRMGASILRTLDNKIPTMLSARKLGCIQLGPWKIDLFGLIKIVQSPCMKCYSPIVGSLV